MKGGLTARFFASPLWGGRHAWRAGWGAIVLAALIGGIASAQTPPPFYKGKQIVMLIASGAGGGYDAYARTLARHMGAHIPGNPAIVPKNAPGAGGLIAAQHAL